MNTKITTALFDLDGVLIDSELLVTKAFEHVFASFGISDRHDERTTALSGCTLREVYESVATGPDVTKMIQAHVDFQARSLHLVTAFDDTISTLSELREKGVHTGVITSRSFNAHSTIAHCGMGDLIELVVAFEDVKDPKPHPEGILKAMAHFSARESQTIMVGDMPADIQAGKGANVITIGLDTSSQLRALKESKPDHIVHSLKDLIPLFFSS